MAIVPLGDRLVFRAFYIVGYPDMVALISFCLIAPCIVGLHIIRNRSDLPGADHRLTDAFEDGVVDTKDIAAIAEYLMGKNPANFSKNNADANKDGTINVADIVEIVNIIKDNK